MLKVTSALVREMNPIFCSFLVFDSEANQGFQINKIGSIAIKGFSMLNQKKIINKK